MDWCSRPRTEEFPSAVNSRQCRLIAGSNAEERGLWGFSPKRDICINPSKAQRTLQKKGWEERLCQEIRRDSIKRHLLDELTASTVTWTRPKHSEVIMDAGGVHSLGATANWWQLRESFCSVWSLAGHDLTVNYFKNKQTTRKKTQRWEEGGILVWGGGHIVGRDTRCGALQGRGV